MSRAFQFSARGLAPTSILLAAVCWCASAFASATCELRASKSFGEACYAAAGASLSDGASATFPNVRPGYRGAITATCEDGRISWSQEQCTRIAASGMLPIDRLASAAPSPQAGKSTASANPARAATSLATATGERSNYLIGTYYFPGWKSNQVGNARKQPWDVLKLYADREPLLGWYEEDAPGVMDRQLQWMRSYGLDYVVFDFMWSADNQPVLPAGINAYLAAQDHHGVGFSVLWANHTTYTFSKAQLEALFSFWASRYFRQPDYVKIDGKPVVFLFSGPVLDANARALGMSTAELLASADRIARAQGLPGVLFVAGSTPSTYDYRRGAYSGYSAYNYHSPATVALKPARPDNAARSFAELDASYQNQWAAMQDNGASLYIVPMTAGWDKRPWGGSKDPQHDDSRSTPEEFRQHLNAARRFMDQHAGLTRRMGVICCWNEFGEGSFIEPTRLDGFQYLQQVRDVFGPH